MKSIKLIHVIQPDKTSIFTKDKYFTVALGNGSVRRFKNKKLAYKYLIDVSKHLTYKLHDLHLCFASVNAMYIDNFFYYDRMPRAEFLLNEHSSEIQKYLNIMVERTAYANGNRFVFNHFKTIVDAIMGMATIITKILKGRNCHAECRKLQCLYNRVLQIYEDILKFDLPEKPEKVNNETPILSVAV